MKVRNTHTSTLVIGDTGQVVEPGAEVEVDDELGARLVEQVDRWSAAKKSPSKPKADKAEESEEDNK